MHLKLPFYFLILVISIGFQKALSQESSGIFMIVNGNIEIENGQTLTQAKVGTKVFPGNTIVSGAESRAKIVMFDRNVINIAASTRLQISKYENHPDSGVKNVELFLNSGQVQNNVEQTYDGIKSNFILKTPKSVAGVRGTVFVASFDPQTETSEITTLHGVVSFAQAKDGKTISEPVIIPKGHTSSIIKNGLPDKPRPTPLIRLRKIEKETFAKETKKSPDAKRHAIKSEIRGKERRAKPNR